MRRKLLAKLLQIAEPIDAESLRPILLDSNQEEAADARAVLAASLQTSRRAGVIDPQQFYRDICDATPEQLALSMDHPRAASFPLPRIARAQALLKDQLTSKAGRPATGSPKARQTQVAEAQARRREKLANQENRKQINEWISTGAAERLSMIQRAYGCRSRVEALELVLQEEMLAILQERLPTT